MKLVSTEAYEVAALALRYWFMVLGVLIVWRSFSWIKKDRRYRKKRLQQLPDAGMVGELVVISGSEELASGDTLPMPREGTLGSARICDVYLPAPGIASRQGDFRFKNGLGVTVMPAWRKKIHIDGVDYTHKQEPGIMHHGSKLVIGQVVLRLRLFVGLETSQSMKAALQPDGQLEGLTQYVQEYYQENPDKITEVWEEEWQFATKPYKRTPRNWDDGEIEIQGTLQGENAPVGGFEIRESLYPEGEGQQKKDNPPLLTKKSPFKRKNKKE